jgi:hypothetical protein
MPVPQRALPPLGGLASPPADPHQGTPPRTPGSVRRTSHLNATWPGGRGQDMHIDAAARDLVTMSSGAVAVVGEQQLHVTVDRTRVLTSIGSSPAVEALPGLVGGSGGSGYRRRLRELLPHEADAGSLPYFLLDDMPGVTLVGPFAWRLWPEATADMRRATQGADREAAGIRTVARMRDICSGFRSDGLPIQRMMNAKDPQHNLVPARDLAQPDDPVAWHVMPPQPAGSAMMRRRRLVDVAAGEQLAVTSLFRDSIWAPDGTETVVHEYGLHAAVDPRSLRLTAIRADPRVLPFDTCPAAARNVDLLLGEPMRTLRDRVVELVLGTDGCTHLNDALRALAEVPVMLGELAFAS